MTKTVGEAGKKTTIGPEFENRGELVVVKGTLSFSVAAKQTRAAATTSIPVGATLGAPQYTIEAGKLSGGGTIEGVVKNTGGIVIPSIDGADPAKLVITGDYDQGAGGELQILIDTTGAHLQVSGTAKMDGKVTLRRDQTVGLTGGLVTFLSFNTVDARPGLVYQTDPPRDSWIGVDGKRYTFRFPVIPPTAKEFQFQIIPVAPLRGMGWRDTNGDGLRNLGEPVFAGVPVSVFTSRGVFVASTVTDSNGQYTFSTLTDGNYYVRFGAPSGYTFTTADQGSDDSLDSDAGRYTGVTATFAYAIDGPAIDLDAGFVVLPDGAGAIAGDLAFIDLDLDGIRDTNESGLYGVVVRLLDSQGNVLATTTTDDQGGYHFIGLPPGTYRLEFVAPPGYQLTLKDQGGDDSTDSDADPLTGLTDFFTLGVGQTRNDLDAGFKLIP